MAHTASVYAEGREKTLAYSALRGGSENCSMKYTTLCRSSTRPRCKDRTCVRLCVCACVCVGQSE